MTSYFVKVDSLDSRLIALLGENSRTATSEISRHLGVSRSTVQSRMDRLIRDGLIERFTVELGTEYESRRVKAHVLIKVNQAQTGVAHAGLRRIAQVTAIYAISGEYDMIAVIAAESTVELNRLLDEVASLDGITRTNSSVVLETILRR
ncbi:MAG: Lrp/AsnC family transcriptional regulator [Gammaproteobacteria bacterium]|nr:Lrp/AsnC family transcriptional regulator [Gammaproteobacteria bacterium]